MSQLAKVFVVINLILAVSFAGVAATLFTARQHYKQELGAVAKMYTEDAQAWKNKQEEFLGKIEKQVTSISSLETERETLRAQKENLDRDLQATKTRLAQEEKDKKTLEDRIVEKDRHIANKDGEIARLTQSNEDLEIAKRGAEDSEKKAVMSDSRTRLVNDNLDRQLTDQNKLMTSYKGELDDLQSLTNRVKERYPHVWEQIAIEKPAPPIDGQVVAVNQEQGIVVLSVGADDQVERGHEFTVFRGDRFVGKVRATKVTSDLSGARIMYLDGDVDIQVRDSVTTRIGN